MRTSKLALQLVVGFFLLSLALGLLVLGSGALQSLSRQSHLLRLRQLQDKEKEFLDLSRSHREWLAAAREYAEFKRFCLNASDFAQFRQNLNSLLAGNRLDTQTLSFQNASLSAELNKITLQISLFGDYVHIKKFIYDMESAGRLTYFSQVQLSATARALSGKFSLEVYFAR